MIVDDGRIKCSGVGGAFQSVWGDLPQDGADPLAQHEAGAQPLRQRGARVCPAYKQGQN